MKKILIDKKTYSETNTPSIWFASKQIHELESESMRLKQSINDYKWIEAEKGRGLEWDEAKKEWMGKQSEEVRRKIKLAEKIEPYMLLDA